MVEVEVKRRWEGEIEGRVGGDGVCRFEGLGGRKREKKGGRWVRGEKGMELGEVVWRVKEYGGGRGWEKEGVVVGGGGGMRVRGEGG